ncbi:MAG: DUF3857 domain-containing protein, partial [Acidobacteria bacterium]|nr:DUF3857 domain-containing protein [Acidobacteriota bacterium]
MTHRIARCSLLLLLVAAAAAPAARARGGDELPVWLQQAVAAPAPTYDRDVPAVVLHREAQVTVGADGRLATVKTYAVRILTREGRYYAMAAAHYATDTGKVRELRAWLIRPGGQVKRYGKDETVDVAAMDNDVYNESRMKAVVAGDDAEVGAVFGYQSITEERALFPQDVWAFQDRLPTLLARYRLALPAGWSAVGVTFNHAGKVEPTASGSSYTWELRNLPP